MDAYAYYIVVYDRHINPFDSYYWYNAFPVLSYVRSGYANLFYDFLRNAGAEGYVSSYLADELGTDARAFSLTSQNTNPSDSGRRYNAFPELSYVRSGVINLDRLALRFAGTEANIWLNLAGLSRTDADRFGGNGSMIFLGSKERFLAFLVQNCFSSTILCAERND